MDLVVGRATRWLGVVALALLVAGCGLEEPAAERDALDPLHGPVDPAALAPRFEAAQPLPDPVADTGDQWRVGAVLDGRTLELFQGLERVTVTLGGIEVPVEGECLADRARDSLTFITGGGRPVVLRTPVPPGRDRLDGVRAESGAGDDLAEVMLSLGLARHDGGGVDPETYAAAEAEARDNGLGLWSEC